MLFLKFSTRMATANLMKRRGRRPMKLSAMALRKTSFGTLNSQVPKDLSESCKDVVFS